ncbi:3'-5' exonuclease [Anaerobutyricum hallii]|uniref:3'-5' exonuclease n=1 Tax=Anaerobutyricum hallii TaxID=39488 RepID=UPI003A4B56BA
MLLDCIDEILPSARYIGSPEDNEDVRCMYVAVTRAKNTLYMIVPKIVLKYGKA